MSWIGRIVTLLTGGVVGVAYATGFDEIILRTLMNWVSSIFLYFLAQFIDLLVWLIDLLPALPYSSSFSQGISQIILVAVRVNTFLPVEEFFYIFGFVVGFLLIFITIKLILKIIPWAIG